MYNTEDENDDDLFIEFDNLTVANLNVSANLISVVDIDAVDNKCLSLQKSDKSSWVAPVVSGLKNSLDTQSGKQWYLDYKFMNKPDPNKPFIRWPD